MRVSLFYPLKRTYMHKFVAIGAGLLVCATALAQQYSIITVAGGAPPATPISATNISIGQPNRVTLDKSGNIYFSASNSVFKMSPAGTLTLIAGNSRAGFSGDGGPATAAQLNGPRGLAFDGAGNLYIADSRNNRVRIVAPNGIINTFAGTGVVSPGGGPTAYGDGGPATSAFLHLPSGVAVDSSGDVYIADTADNIIREVTPDGLINTIAGDSYPSFLGDTGQAINAELYGPEDVALDSSGNIYIADTQNGRIRQVNTSGVINSYAGDGTIGYAGDGAAGTSAEIWAPYALAVDSSGDVYFVENGDSRIRVIKASTTFASDIASGTAPVSGNISTVAGNGSAGFAGDGSAATNAELNFPSGIALDSSGNLYIADALNLRVRKISGTNISTVAGNGVMSYSGDGGAATAAQMNSPQAVAVDPSGNIYVADTANNVVRRVTTDGIIRPSAGHGSAGFGGDGNAATSAQLNGPRGLAVDSAGNVYIADTKNARVRMVAPSGTISTVAGNGTSGYGGDSAAAASAQLYTPVGLAVDASGNLYIADFNNNRIRMVTPGGTISTVAGTGNAGYSGDGGPASSAQLNYPIGVAVDSGHYVIRKVLSGGQIYTIAGNGLAGYSGDGGQAVQAQIGSPAAVAADSAWNIYFTDGSARVRKVYTNGYIVAAGGNGTVGYSGDGGPAVNAQLDAPEGLALDSKGNVYLADSANNAVRELQPLPSGIAITAVVSAASNQTGAICPGDVVTIYGSGLGAAGVSYSLVNGVVPQTLSGTYVYFNNAAAPVLYASSTQINVVAPFGLTGQTAQVVVNYLNQTSAPQTVNVIPAAPTLFTANASGTGQVAAINVQDGTVNGPAHPAHEGTYVALYATGSGQSNPPSQDGAIAAVPLPLVPSNLGLSVTIGGRAATLEYAGAAPDIVEGVIQVNALIPTGIPPGPVPVVLQISGINSQNGVTIWITN
jgi:trimeric autotransporter adhesin